MISLRFPVTVLVVAVATLLPQIAAADPTTAFMWINNDAYIKSTVSWDVSGSYENDQPEAPPCCFEYTEKSCSICCSGSECGTSVSKGQTDHGNFQGNKFTLTWSAEAQVSPSFVPYLCGTRQCLQVGATHTLETCATASECGYAGFGADVSSEATNEVDDIPTLEFALITLDPCTTPVGTSKTIDWTFSLDGTGSGEASFTGDWSLYIGGANVLSIEADDSGISGTYVDSMGDTQETGEMVDFSDGIDFGVYGTYHATVSSESSPSVAVWTTFDSNVSGGGTLNVLSEVNLEWKIQALIVDP